MGAILIGIVVGGAVLIGLSAKSAAAETCAAVAEGSISEPTAYVPYQEGWGLLEQPILRGDVATLDPAAAGVDRVSDLDGRPRQLTLDLGKGGSVTYFSDKPIDANTLPSDFMAAGGVQLERYPVDDVVFYESLLAEFPDRAIAVEFGPYKGAMTWADPEANGVRTHNVYWSEGKYNMSLITDRSAAAALTIARVVACKG